MKYWEELLTAWRAQGKTGFSIPFIIGSQQYLPQNHVRQGIGELLTDIATSDSIQVYLSYCYIMNDFILAELDDAHCPENGFFPSLENVSQDRFYVSAFLELETDLQSISNKLTERLEHYVQNEQYSSNEGERGSYTPSEVAFIKRCFS